MAAADHAQPPGAASATPHAVPVRRWLRAALFSATVILMATYAPFARALLALVSCDTATVSVAEYLLLRQSGAVFDRPGVVRPAAVLVANANATVVAADAAARSVVVPVSLLHADPSIVCYEGSHAALDGLAWCLLIVFGLGFPAATACMVRAALLGAKPPGCALGPTRGRSRGLEAAVAAAPAVVATTDTDIAALSVHSELAHVEPFTAAWGYYRPSKWFVLGVAWGVSGETHGV